MGDVDADEVGIAEVARPIRERVLERLGQQVQVRGRAAPVARQVRVGRVARRQHAQRLDERHAARRRRRHRQDPQPAVAGLERLALGHARSPPDRPRSARRPPPAPPRRSRPRSPPCRRHPARPRAACRASTPDRVGGRSRLPARLAREDLRELGVAVGGLGVEPGQALGEAPRDREAARGQARRPDRRSGANGSAPNRRTISPSPRTSPGTATASPPRFESSGCALPSLKYRAARSRPAPARGSRARTSSSPWRRR